MDFIDQIKQFSKRVEGLKETIATEEDTKTSIIMPFFSMMGYDVFNPMEFSPEFVADVGIKKGEKVDYAILNDGKPVILIECKWIGEQLDRHDSQLFRYFGTTCAKFGILTNGILYRFYTDLDEPNKMDDTPFLEINILDLKDAQVAELKKFHKSVFNVDEILNVASELKYSNEIRQFFAAQLQEPSDEFVRLFLSNIYKGQKTQNVIEKFRPIIKKSLNQFISEMMNDKIKNALKNAESAEPPAEVPEEEEKPPKIITTEDELEGFFLIKNLLKDLVPMEDLAYKDTESYLAVNYKNNTRKWVCRLVFTPTQKVLILPDENKKACSFPLESIYDLNNYREQLVEVVSRYL